MPVQKANTGGPPQCFPQIVPCIPRYALVLMGVEDEDATRVCAARIIGGVNVPEEGLNGLFIICGCPPEALQDLLARPTGVAVAGCQNAVRMCSAHHYHNGCEARLVYGHHAGRHSAAAKADQADARCIDFVAPLGPVNQTADVDTGVSPKIQVLNKASWPRLSCKAVWAPTIPLPARESTSLMPSASA